MRKRLQELYLVQDAWAEANIGNKYMKDLEENSEIRKTGKEDSGPEFLSEVPRGKEFLEDLKAACLEQKALSERLSYPRLRSADRRLQVLTSLLQKDDRPLSQPEVGLSK